MFPEIGKTDRFERCPQGLLFHKQCSTTGCPHLLCQQLPAIYGDPKQHSQEEASARQRHEVIVRQPPRLAYEIQDMKMLVISKVWSLPNILHQTKDILISRVRLYRAMEMQPMLNTLVKYFDPKMQQSTDMMKTMTKAVIQDPLFTMSTSGLNMFCNGCKPLLVTSLVLASHLKVMGIDDIINVMGLQNSNCRCGDTCKDSSHTSKLFVKRSSTCNGNTCEAKVDVSDRASSDQCKSVQQNIGLYRPVKEQCILDFLCTGHSKKTIGHARCICRVFPAFGYAYGKFAECSKGHLYHRTSNGKVNDKSPHRPCVIESKIEAPANHPQPQTTNPPVFHHHLYETAINSPLRPILRSPGYKVSLIGRTLYHKDRPLDISILQQAATENHVFRCGWKCRRNSRYWFTGNKILAKERCDCYTDTRLLPSIRLSRNEIQSIIEEFHFNRIRPVCRCEYECAVMQGRTNRYRANALAVTFLPAIAQLPRAVSPKHSKPEATPNNDTSKPATRDTVQPRSSKRKRRVRLDFLTTMIMIMLYLPTKVKGHRMNACDWRHPQLLGVLDLGKDNACNLPPLDLECRLVKYQVYENRSLTRTFAGHACEAWIRGRKVDTFWDWSRDTSTQSDFCLAGQIIGCTNMRMHPVRDDPYVFLAYSSSSKDFAKEKPSSLETHFKDTISHSGNQPLPKRLKSSRTDYLTTGALPNSHF